MPYENVQDRFDSCLNVIPLFKPSLYASSNTVGLWKNEISLLVHFDIVIGFLFHCSFSAFILFYFISWGSFLYICGTYRRGIIKSNGAKSRQITLSSTLLLRSTLPAYKPIRSKKLHAKDSVLLCFVLCVWIIPCNKSSCTPSLSLSDVNKTEIYAYTYTHCLSWAGNVLIRGSLLSTTVRSYSEMICKAKHHVYIGDFFFLI